MKKNCSVDVIKWFHKRFFPWLKGHYLSFLKVTIIKKLGIIKANAKHISMHCQWSDTLKIYMKQLLIYNNLVQPYRDAGPFGDFDKFDIWCNEIQYGKSFFLHDNLWLNRTHLQLTLDLAQGQDESMLKERSSERRNLKSKI